MIGIANRLAHGLDRVSWFSLRISALALAAIVAATASEIVLRYFFNNPMEWVGDTVGFLLCGAIFLAVPEVARQRGHVAIPILVESLPERAKLPIERLIYFTSGAACALAAWVCGHETLRQIASGIQTVGTFTIPKWWVSAFIVLGFALTSLQFLRLALHRSTAHSANVP